VFVRVAVPVPSLDLLTYSVPTGQPAPAIGARVVVPLGTRSVTGIVVDVSAASDAPDGKGIKPLKTVLDTEPFIPADVVELARWTAEYYAAGPGEAITAVLPPKTRGERVDSHKTTRMVTLTAAGTDPQARVTARQREALDILAGAPAGVASPELARRGVTADIF
jgi:primosomal protein N' (replication factor Y) (superfamily II helicase)